MRDYAGLKSHSGLLKNLLFTLNKINMYNPSKNSLHFRSKQIIVLALLLILLISFILLLAEEGFSRSCLHR